MLTSADLVSPPTFPVHAHMALLVSNECRILTSGEATLCVSAQLPCPGSYNKNVIIILFLVTGHCTRFWKEKRPLSLHQTRREI
jgi:hypothetical protein